MSANAATAALVVDSRCTLGEGIVWCERRRAVLWTDIEGRRLWMHDPASGVTRNWEAPDRVGSFALCESGRVLLGLAKGLALANLDAGHDRVLVAAQVAEVERDVPGTRVNDGRADRAGNFVFGTMSDDHKERIGRFYQYSTSHGLRRLDLEPVRIANSICFSPDGKTMYFCDSPRRRIMQCDYDAASAQVADIREFADLKSHPGFPDGSTVDADGGLWNAEWGSSTIRRYTADGRVDRQIAVPAKNPSCVAFGGPHLDELYITTARQDMTPQELEAMPQAGGVYRAALGVGCGLLECKFNDR